MVENCNGEIISIDSNDLCFEGHNGGLCEACDLYNIRKQGFYTVST